MREKDGGNIRPENYTLHYSYSVRINPSDIRWNSIITGTPIVKHFTINNDLPESKQVNSLGQENKKYESITTLNLSDIPATIRELSAQLKEINRQMQTLFAALNNILQLQQQILHAISVRVLNNLPAESEKNNTFALAHEGNNLASKMQETQVEVGNGEWADLQNGAPDDALEEKKLKVNSTNETSNEKQNTLSGVARNGNTIKYGDIELAAANDNNNVDEVQNTNNEQDTNYENEAKDSTLVQKELNKLASFKDELSKIKGNIPKAVLNGMSLESFEYFSGDSWKVVLKQLRKIKLYADFVIFNYVYDKDKSDDEFKQLLQLAQTIQSDVASLMDLPKLFLKNRIEFIKKARRDLNFFEAYLKNLNPTDEEDILDKLDNHTIPAITEIIETLNGPLSDELKLVWSEILKRLNEYKKHDNFDKFELEDILYLIQFLLINISLKEMVRIREAIYRFIFAGDLDTNNSTMYKPERSELSKLFKQAIRVNPQMHVLKKVKYFDPYSFLTRKVKRKVKNILKDAEAYTVSAAGVHKVIKGMDSYNNLLSAIKNLHKTFIKYMDSEMA